MKQLTKNSTILEKALWIKIVDSKLTSNYKTKINKVKTDSTIKYELKG